MALRIVNNDGLGYSTKVLDAETGEDLTTRLHVSKIEMVFQPHAEPTALLTVYAPKVELTVEEAQVKQVCPYCGHTVEKTLHSADDVKEQGE